MKINYYPVILSIPDVRAGIHFGFKQADIGTAVGYEQRLREDTGHENGMRLLPEGRSHDNLHRTDT